MTKNNLSMLKLKSKLKLKAKPKLMQGIHVTAKLGLGVGMVTLLMACSSSKTPNFYSLTPTLSPAVKSNKVRMIEVLPVGLADRLNRIPLVIQNPNGQSKVLHDDRWTSTMAAELRDGLSAGLQQQLGAVDRYNSGMTGGQAAYRIAADFSHFDFVERAANQREVVVAAAWTIKFDDPNRPLSNPKNAQTIPPSNQLSCRYAFNQAVPKGQSLNDIVKTSRDSLAQVVQAVTQSVLHLENKTVLSIASLSCN